MSIHVKLGKSDLYVNPIGLGTNAVGGHNLYPNLDEEVGKEVVRTALTHGMNFLDTAFIYGPKRSEELIGEVIQEMGNRQEAVIATKAAHKFVDNKVVFDNSPTFLKQSVEDSLLRLKTDYIDLFYIHYPDEHTPKYEAVGALKELKDEGKIRAIGVSNFSLDQLKEANKDGYVDVFQGEYNLLNRSAENEIFPYTIENQISFIPYFLSHPVYLRESIQRIRYSMIYVPKNRISKEKPLFAIWRKLNNCGQLLKRKMLKSLTLSLPGTLPKTESRQSSRAQKTGTSPIQPQNIGCTINGR